MSHTQEIGEATSHKSSLYADTITLQKTITSLYILLAMWLFVLVSKVCREMAQEFATNTRADVNTAPSLAVLPVGCEIATNWSRDPAHIHTCSTPLLV